MILARFFVRRLGTFLFCRQFRNVPNCQLGNDKTLVHLDGFGAGIAALKVQAILVAAGSRLVVACQRRHDFVLMVRGLCVL